jgi:glycosyltransferase involved in cell wall biosynthesis
MATTATTGPGLLAPPARADHDIVLILGYTSWAGAARRGRVHAEDRLTLELIGSERAGRVLVCNPFRSLPAKLVRSTLGSEEPFPGSETRWLHEPTRLRRNDPTGTAAIERSCAAYERSARAAAEEFGLHRPAVIVTHPLIAGFGDFGWAGPVTYYANDDLTAFPPLARWRPAIEASFARMRREGRRAVALTPRSLRSIGPSGLAAIVPCGIEPEEWIEPGTPPAWFIDLPEPRLLYVGTLDERIDLGAVRKIAESRPEASLTLVGPGAGSARFASLRSLPQVTVRDAVSREELRGLVAAADVGLIPHVRSAQTEAMSPLKLYEYIAAGTAVAAVDLPGVRGVCPERTVLSPDGAGLAEAVQGGLELGPWTETARREFIAQNAWSARFERLLDIALAPATGRANTRPLLEA